MKIIKYEVKKVLSEKYTMIITAILLLLNIIFCIYTVQNEQRNNISDETKKVYSTYINNPKAFIDEYNTLLVEENEKETVRKQARELQIYDLDLPTSEKYFIYKTVVDKVNYINNYKNFMDIVINDSQENKKSLVNIGIGENTYAYKYQDKLIKTYEKTKTKTLLGLEYAKGWDRFFNYNIYNIFMFIAVILISATAGTIDNYSNAAPVISITKNGRTKTIISKIIAVILIAVAVAMLFILTTLIVFGLYNGYSSIFNAIQIFNNFLYFPFEISVVGYLAVFILYKLLAVTFFTCFVLLIAVLIKNSIPIYIFSLSFYGLNFGIYLINEISWNNFFKLTNIVTVSSTNELFYRYIGFNLFSNPVNYTNIVIFIYSVSIILLCAVCIWLYSRNPEFSNGKSTNALHNAISSVTSRIFNKDRISKPNNIKPHKQRPLIFYEIYKIFSNRKTAVLCIVLILLKIYVSLSIYSQEMASTDKVYKYYMDIIDKLNDDEKFVYIEEENKQMINILSMKQEMNIKRQNDEISHEEYSDYINEYYHYYNQKEGLERILTQSNYITEMREKTGIKVEFIFDIGYIKLFDSGTDIICTAVLLLLLSGILSNEFRDKSGCFANILRCSKNGRKKTFYMKLITSGIISLVTSVAFICIDYVFILRNYEFPHLNYALVSIKNFGETITSISILTYLILFLTVKIIGYLMISCLILAVSGITKNNISTLITMFGIIFIPTLINYLGISFVNIINVDGILSIFKLIDFSTSFNINYFLYCFIYILAYIMFSAMLVFKSKRIFER
jgi:hypothetical protein